MNWFRRIFPKFGVTRAQMAGLPEVKLGQRFVEAHVADEVEVALIELDPKFGFRITFEYRNYPGGFDMHYREFADAIEYGALEDIDLYIARRHALLMQ